MLHAADPDEDFVHVPLVPWPWPAASQAVGKALAEFLAPAPYGLVGDDDAPLGQKQFDVAQAEAEHVVQPHSMADDLRGEAVAVVRVGWRRHSSVSFIPTPAANPGYRWGGRPPTASMCQSGVLMTPHEGGARDDG